MFGGAASGTNPVTGAGIPSRPARRDPTVEGGRGLASEPGALAIVTTVLLGALGQGRPGLLGALLALLVSFVARDKVAIGLSTAFLVGFGVHFYYDLDLSLWTKSGVLVGSGVVLLAVRAWLHHRRFLTEGA